MTKLPVIICRAEPGASETVSHLDQARYAPILSPVLELAPLALPSPNLSGVQGILFTSANGVRFFADWSPARTFNVWCVGPSTLAAARAAGFASAISADGKADDLARLVQANVSPGAGRLLHIANSAAAGDLARRLAVAGYDIEFVALYEARPVPALSEDAQTCLTSASPFALLVHSAKGAAAFAALAGQGPFPQLAVAAMSEMAMAPLTALGCRDIRIAEAPNENALLAALDQLTAAL